MKTLKKINIEPIFVEYMPSELDDNKIYISEECEVAVHLCLCGCKNEVVTPIGKNWWKFEINKNKVSITPSILSKNLNCKSHYIITNNIANFV